MKRYIPVIMFHHTSLSFYEIENESIIIVFLRQRRTHNTVCRLQILCSDLIVCFMYFVYSFKCTVITIIT